MLKSRIIFTAIFPMRPNLNRTKLSILTQEAFKIRGVIFNNIGKSISFYPFKILIASRNPDF